MTTPRPPQPTPTLSPRHTLFLLYILEGRSHKEIAALENIAVPTVSTHLCRIFQTIGVRNKTEAALWAREQGMSARPGVSTNNDSDKAA